MAGNICRSISCVEVARSYASLSAQEEQILNVKLKTQNSKLFVALTLATLLSACSTRITSEPQYVPAANLMDIVKDFQRASRDDLYRFPIAKDVTGVNVMKATLVRLDDYEKKNPRQFPDIVGFSKATAYERLRDYDQALAHYRKVAGVDGQLGAQAAKNVEALEAFKQILDQPVSAQDPFEYIKALDDRVEAWNVVIRKYQGTPHEYLARVEEERIDRAKVMFVEFNRYRLREGNQLGILGYSQLVTKHRQSKNYYRYLLDFGDFYVVLGREYAAQNDPEGLLFDLGVFEQLAKSALRLYTEVAQVDGIVEKIEAQGKIEGLRGLSEKMRRLSR